MLDDSHDDEEEHNRNREHDQSNAVPLDECPRAARRGQRTIFALVHHMLTTGPGPRITGYHKAEAVNILEFPT
jgi:hypothetical protein